MLWFHLLIYKLARPPEVRVRDTGPAFSVTDWTDQLLFFLILHLGININPRNLPKTLIESITALFQRWCIASEPVRERGEVGGRGWTGEHTPFKLVDDEYSQTHKHDREQHQHGRSAVGWSEVHQGGWGNIQSTNMSRVLRRSIWLTHNIGRSWKTTGIYRSLDHSYACIWVCPPILKMFQPVCLSPTVDQGKTEEVLALFNQTSTL